MIKLSYLLLNIAFFLIAALLIRKLDPKPKPRKHILIAGVTLYLMMLVFNTYLTSLAIVRYDWAKVLGLKIISWPIEDLTYLVVALYIVPTLWGYFYSRYDQKTPPFKKSTQKPRIKPRETKANSGHLQAD